MAKSVYSAFLRENEVDVPRDAIRNLRVSVKWGYSSTIGTEAAILDIKYEGRGPDGKWREYRDGGIAFMLEELVQKRQPMDDW